MTRVEMEGTRMSKELSRRRVPFLLNPNPGNTRRIIPRGDMFITERRTRSETMSTETSEVLQTATLQNIDVSIRSSLIRNKGRALGLESVGRGRADCKFRHRHIGHFGATV